MIEFEISPRTGPRIKVVGVGGGGGNAVNNMIRQGINDVEFFVANTDVQALNRSEAKYKIQLGKEATKGLGAGAKPEVGANSARESIDRIEELIGDAEMVFVTAGMGGGTGTGAAPIIAEAARNRGALTVGVVTKPFTFEGGRRMRQADQGIEQLRSYVDTLIVIPNQRLLEFCGANVSLQDSFKTADQVLYDAVRGISDIITQPGLINVDFADAVSVMRDQGRALMGQGRAAGQDRAREAARKAISSPLLEDVSIEGAMGILVNITGGSSLTLAEMNEANTLITNAAHPDANIICGCVIDETMGEELSVIVIATGFDKRPKDNVVASTNAAQTASQDRYVAAINSVRNAPTSPNNALSHNTNHSTAQQNVNTPAAAPTHTRQSPITTTTRAEHVAVGVHAQTSATQMASMGAPVSVGSNVNIVRPTSVNAEQSYNNPRSVPAGTNAVGTTNLGINVLPVEDERRHSGNAPSVPVVSTPIIQTSPIVTPAPVHVAPVSPVMPQRPTQGVRTGGSGSVNNFFEEDLYDVPTFMRRNQ